MRHTEFACPARLGTWSEKYATKGLRQYADYVPGTTIFVDGGMSLYPAFHDNG